MGKVSMLFFAALCKVFFGFRTIIFRVDLFLSFEPAEIFAFMFFTIAPSHVQLVPVFVVEGSADLSGESISSAIIGNGAPFPIHSKFDTPFIRRLAIMIEDPDIWFGEIRIIHFNGRKTPSTLASLGYLHGIGHFLGVIGILALVSDYPEHPAGSRDGSIHNSSCTDLTLRMVHPSTNGGASCHTTWGTINIGHLVIHIITKGFLVS